MASLIASIRPRLQQGLFSALSHRDYRLYFAGQLISVSGTWMQKVASGWLVFYLTRSEMWLGLIACAAGLPALLLSPLAGVLVDRLPRRAILYFTQTVQMLLAFILSALVFTDSVQIWHIVVLSFISGVMDAIDAPTRQAFIVTMVGKEHLSSGIMLNSVMMSTARVIGPTAAGIALVVWGAEWCFLLNGISFLTVIFSLYLMTIEERRLSSVTLPFWKQFREGLAYSRRHSTIAPILLLSGIVCIFTLNMATLLPAFADTVLHSPKEGYAMLSAAHGVGAVAAGLLMGEFHKRLKRGKLVVISALLTPVAVFLLSRTTDLTTAAALVTLEGFGLIMLFVTMNTLIQTEVPDAFRGRVMSLYTLTFFGIAPFGALAMGFIAHYIGTVDTLTLYALLGLALSAWIVARAGKVAQLA